MGQLMVGVRCFDFRVARSLSGEWWLVHLVSLVTLESAVEEIISFLKEYPTERIVARCRVGWEQRNKLTTASLGEKMGNLFSGWLIQDISVPLSLLRSEERIVLVVDGASNVPFFGHWANTNRSAALSESTLQLVCRLENGEKMSPGFVEASFVLTPTGQDVKRSLWHHSEGVKQLAREANSILYEQLQLHQGPLRCNVISIDFADASLVQTIVYRNYLH